ncbi:cell division protein FtsQ [Streptohalobacillus salinus]
MMVFILSMSLYGLSNMITELIPKFYLGPIEFSVEYFAFIPLSLAMIFHPLYAAIGASLGEVIFGEIMLGQFGGIGELEKFIAFSLAIFIAGVIVRNPENKKQVALGAMAGVIIHQFISMSVDILKVWVGVEELDAVEGLAESVVVIEGIAFLNDVLFSGILFALLPTLYLVPRLYGKIEPLLGMKPRKNDLQLGLSEIITVPFILAVVVLGSLSFLFEYLSETTFGWEWEAPLVDRFGEWIVFPVMVVPVIIALSVIIFLVKRKGRKDTDGYSEVV